MPSLRPVEPMPRWIGAHEAAGPADAAFAAGAAIGALDQVIRADPPWLGALRMRLALKAGAAAARLIRLGADEAFLRDAVHLTRPGDDPGPAGRLHGLIRQWTSRPLHLAAETAAAIAEEAGRERGAGALAALIEADRVIAEKLGWRCPLPLQLAVIHDSALRRGEEGRRPRPDGPDWAEQRHAVLRRAAMLAHAEAVQLSRRAEALAAAADRLRTRESAKGLALILSDESVAPWRMVGRTGHGSDRAARRFCESLQARGALRLLTDRPSFRLYGL